jgi:hypothetical protein
MARPSSSADIDRSPEGPHEILYARTRAGFELPIIDVTHPRFAVADDPAARRAYKEAFLADDRQRRWIPAFLLRLLLRGYARTSRLAAAMFNPADSYLDGITTYVMKLGAANLVPPFDSPADRRFAASPHVTLLRLRTQQTATLIAEAIAGDPAFAGSASLHLINIAGGPALDSINALIILKRTRPDLLRRPIVIHVLDRNEDGAFFGANALAVLKEKGHPLENVDAALELDDYDWNEPASLARLLQKITAKTSAVAASSEGGLLEYGTDAAITENLRVLHDHTRFVVGSVTSGDKTRRRMIAMSGFKVIPRGLEGLRPLAETARFAIVKSEPALLSDQVLMRPF